MSHLSSYSRRLYMAACHGKEAFTSRGIAVRVASRRSQRGKPCKVYLCEGCKKFHIGTPKK